MQENALHAARLHFFARAAASIPPRLGSLPPTRGQLRRLLNTGPLSYRTKPWYEDPPGDAFTVEFAFYNGSFLVMPSVAGEASFVLRHLVDATFLHPGALPSAVRARAYQVLLAALAVSDASARRAGLVRGLDPNSCASRDVTVPSRRRLARLKHAVTFGPTERAALLAAYSLPPDALEPLTLERDTAAHGTGLLGEDVLDARPIVSCGDTHIVAVPSMLLTAARHALLRLAIEYGAVLELAWHYRDSVWAAAHEALADMHIHCVGEISVPIAIPNAIDGLYRCDTDKLIYVLLIADSLDTYDPATPNGTWPVDELVSMIEERLRQVRTHLLSEQQLPLGLLCLVLIQGVGRPLTLQITDPSADLTQLKLVMSVADLATFAALERRDPLALWSFARAMADAREHTPIVAIAPLDEYYFYRKLGYTYPPPADDQEPRPLLMPLRGTGELHREVQRKHDWHGAPFRGGIIEVVAAHDPAQPIYTTAGAGPPIIAHCVEGLPLPLWVVSPPFEDEEMLALMEVYLYLTNTVAYWAWQCAPSLQAMLRPLAGCHTCLYIELRLPGKGVLSPDISSEDELPAAKLSRVVDRATGTVVLTAHEISQLFAGADNMGERELVWQVLHGLRDLLDDYQRGCWPPGALDTILDRHVPLGMKKRFMSLNAGYAPDIDPRGLPPWPPRTLHQPALQDVQRELRPLIRQRMAAEMLDRATTKKALSRLLNAMVQIYFGELETLVASLDSQGLLEALVAQHEALVRERGLGRINIPTLAIGLAEVPDVFADERTAHERTVRAATAARFVIEYVVARPPTGRLLLNLSIYDRLQALAALIIEFGAKSDAIYYDLIQLGVAPFSADAITNAWDAFVGAMGRYGAAYAHGEIVRLTESFADYWPSFSDTDAAASSLITAVDHATVVEWGCALTDLHALMAELVDIGFESGPLVATMDCDELIERLAATLQWPVVTVAHVLTRLSLQPRGAFLSPPAPHVETDVYPWRYTRDLSVLRRPLLERRHGDKVEFVWGPRHVYTAERYLVDLILSGRMEPHTPEMARLRTDILQRRGTGFNRAVYELLTACPGIVVRQRVKKIGRLDGLARHLGDVDVLAADPRTRTMWVIECKAFAPARIPFELQGEIHKLLVGREDRLSAAERHARRARYICEHITEIVAAFGLGTTSGWMVEAFIVVDQELATPYLRQSPVPVLSFEQFKAIVSTW
jgi:hypothetical protein